MVHLPDGGPAEGGRYPLGAQVNWVSAVRTGDAPTIVVALQDGRVVGLRPWSIRCAAGALAGGAVAVSRPGTPRRSGCCTPQEVAPPCHTRC